MEELLRFIVESLVEDKESIQISESQAENAVIYEVSVSDNDIGKIIGKNGKVAQAIRAILHSAGHKDNKKVIFKIQKA